MTGLFILFFMSIANFKGELLLCQMNYTPFSMIDSPFLRDKPRDEIIMYPSIPAILMGVPFGTAGGVSAVGAIMGQRGSFLGALLGAYVGFGGVVCCFYGVAITIPIGAVMGNNKQLGFLGGL